jgi:hypothetical protein
MDQKTSLAEITRSVSLVLTGYNATGIDRPFLPVEVKLNVAVLHSTRQHGLDETNFDVSDAALRHFQSEP